MFPNGSQSFGFYGYPHFISNEPSFFSLQDLRDEVVQESPILKLDTKLLVNILEYVPLKDRLLRVRSVCRKMSEAAKKSVKSVEFLRDELDYCDDAKIAFFLSVYGKHVEHMNFDLFRSCSPREYTQWSWRQSVIASVTKCAELKHLDIMICCRHKIRDGDLQVIFKHCTNLETLRMDASFVNGNCFTKSPVTLRKLELECCQAFGKQNFLTMCFRLFRLETLHVSLLSCLDEQVIKRIGDMKKLSNLSIIADPDVFMDYVRIAEIRRLPRLRTLCLDGVPMVTDRFLSDLCDIATSQASKSLQHISLAFCRNIGPHGIAKLKQLPNLKSLNLDGVSKRDISAGVESLASLGRLERLFVAEDTNISPKTIVEVVTKCENLRTLDISSSSRLGNKGFAESLYNARAFSYGDSLKILTDNKNMWSRIPPYNELSRVEIIYIGIPDDRYIEAISVHTAQHLPRGYLIPDLRRGNRYKMLDPSLDMSAEQQEPEVTSPIASSPEAVGFQEQENKAPSPDFFERIDNMENFQAAFKQQEEEFTKLLRQMQNASIPMTPESNMFHPDISSFFPVDPTWAPFSFTDFENSITVGTAGAPGPPTDNGSQNILRHSRPSRNNRQAQKEKAAQRRSAGSRASGGSVVASPAHTGPAFTDDDFPPL